VLIGWSVRNICNNPWAVPAIWNNFTHTWWKWGCDWCWYCWGRWGNAW
jgi:hypothetical protein